MVYQAVLFWCYYKTLTFEKATINGFSSSAISLKEEMSYNFTT